MKITVLFASRFADQRRHAHSKWAWRVNDAQAQRFDIQPGGPLQFRAPVYLLTSDLTVSAAEVFVLAMRALPQVTQVGGTTRGAFSDILAKTLPNGRRLGLSNEIYVDPEGASFEGAGLSPARMFPVFIEGRMEAGHLEVLRSFVADLRRLFARSRIIPRGALNGRAQPGQARIAVRAVVPDLLESEWSNHEWRVA
jgi:carboxyl-terminal processing protease